MQQASNQFQTHIGITIVEPNKIMLHRGPAPGQSLKAFFYVPLTVLQSAESQERAGSATNTTAVAAPEAIAIASISFGDKVYVWTT